MNQGLVIGVHATTALVGGSGLVLAWFRWVAPSTPDLGGEELLAVHPCETWSLVVHLMCAAPLLVLLGCVIRDHAIPRLRGRVGQQRHTGIVLLALAAPMTLSGPLIQVASNESLRHLAALVHLITGAAWFGGYVVHIVARPIRSASHAIRRRGVPSTGTRAPAAASVVRARNA